MPEPILGTVTTNDDLTTPGTRVTLNVRVRNLGEPKYAYIKYFNSAFQYGVITDEVAKANDSNGRPIVRIEFEVPEFNRAKQLDGGGEELEVTVENSEGDEGSTVYP